MPLALALLVREVPLHPQSSTLEGDWIGPAAAEAAIVTAHVIPAPRLVPSIRATTRAPDHVGEPVVEVGAAVITVVMVTAMEALEW
jgi:hypothetical protein